MTATALTDRERQVLNLLARGYTHVNIAAVLGISLNGVRSRLFTARKKLGLDLSAGDFADWAANNKGLFSITRSVRPAPSCDTCDTCDGIATEK